ncbi:MAG: alanine/ornithine racemase family PLP-dependent enzyme [Planctomycetia bacterium]
MLARPTITVDLGKVRDNARTVVGRLPGISVVAVTKVTCGSPQIGRAMLGGGAKALGDSRLENIQRLRDAGVTAPLWLLRAPPPELAGETVQLADVSLESEIETVVALENAAAATGRRHAIVAMVDLGDLREGMLPAALPAFLARVDTMDHLDIAGIGVNLTCYGAIVPDEDNLGRLADLALQSEKHLGRSLLVSGGNSGSIGMVLGGRMPAAINTLRIGESILLGVDTLTRDPLPLGLRLDAFVVSAPVIECLVKPSLPIGTSAQDAFGNRPTFRDRGERRRAICALGRQDAPPEGLVPVDPRVKVLGASSDHLILDVEDLERPPALGEPLSFVPNYAATLQLFTSPYVHKVFTPPA